MIEESFLHCTGIGPKIEKKLKDLHFITWDDCFEKSNDLPLGETKRKQFISTLEKSKEALVQNNISYFTRHFPTKDHWRILSHFFNNAVFFDIETTGLNWNESKISVIVMYHQRKLVHFIYEENLDDFLSYLEKHKIDLLVSFNGNSFDIPMIEKAFNIPSLNIPHVDIRWIAYHAGLRGGLKKIEQKLSIKRPLYLSDVDGLEAVHLFYDWQDGDANAKNKLISYCMADVLGTYLISKIILATYYNVPMNIESDGNLFSLIQYKGIS